jgi:hypothetical protein
MKHLFTLTFGIIFLIFLNACGGGSGDDTPSTLADDNTTFPNVVLHDPSFTTTHFSGSQNCAQCHDGINDANGTDVSIVKAWQGTMMANAATDPFWKAKVATEVKEHPEFKQTIEAKCSRCHTPMANVEATYNGDTVALSDDGFFNHDNYYYDAAMQGVSCTLCHQIENTPQLGTTNGFSGAFVIDTNNTGTERKIYGPYTKPNPMPMQNNVQFTPEYSPHMNESKLCAACHSLETPVIATDGTLTDFTFPEQAAYTEWEYSDFNATQSCQDCHMPKAEGSVIISTKGNVGERSPFFQHKFLGANTYMLEILKNNRQKLGVLADETRFNESITDTREFLKAAADVNITQSSVENGLLNFDVLVTNHSGHKFPTGFPSRRAWIHVTVKNSADQVLFESGAVNSEGQINGVVYDTASNTYEPHYEKITDPSQVQIYETILQDTDDKMTYILLHALHYLKDNRILPKGLNKDDVNLPETINPHGNAETDSDFIGGSDTVKYEIKGLEPGEYTIIATLHYQSLSFGFAQDLYKNAELPEVALMKALDAGTTNRYETISTDSISITIP